MTDRNGNQDSDTVYVRIEDLGPEAFQIPPATHTVVNYPEGAEAFLENTRVTPDGSGTGYPPTAPTGLTADAGYRFFLTVVDSDGLTATGERSSG